MKNIGTSDRYQNNNLKAIIAYSKFLGPAISFNKETNATTTSDKKYVDLNDSSFIDKMISETTDPELVAQLEKAKRNCVFYY
jgi:hypothetical protein